VRGEAEAYQSAPGAKRAPAWEGDMRKSPGRLIGPCSLCRHRRQLGMCGYRRDAHCRKCCQDWCGWALVVKGGKAT